LNAKGGSSRRSISVSRSTTRPIAQESLIHAAKKKAIDAGGPLSHPGQISLVARRVDRRRHQTYNERNPVTEFLYFNYPPSIRLTLQSSASGISAWGCELRIKMERSPLH